MPLMIDGHNLIGKLSGVELSDPDDEARLIALLLAYCARTRKPVTVYFDRGAAGSSNPPARGGLSVRFITPPRTADDAIRDHLRRLGRQSGNWTVISSDSEVQNAARRAGAKTLPSTAFARQLRSGPHQAAPEKPDQDLSPDEIDDLLRAFQERRKQPRP